MKPIILTIPAPCDWLRLNGGHGNRYARNAQAQKWRQAAAWQARKLRLTRLTDYPVRIIATIHLDTNPPRWDATNWLPTAKHAIDGLVWSAKHGGADVLVDDSNRYVVGPDMRAGARMTEPTLTLRIEPLNQEDAS